jgi:hypothetical protein
MKIDVTRPLLGFNGKPIPAAGEGGEARPLLLRDVLCMALTATVQGEQPVVGTEKVRRFVLAQRVFQETEPDLSAEDIALCKGLLDKVYGVVVVGPAWLMLDPPSSTSG